jgi:hypothetical protein
MTRAQRTMPPKAVHQWKKRKLGRKLGADPILRRKHAKLRIRNVRRVIIDTNVAIAFMSVKKRQNWHKI